MRDGARLVAVCELDRASHRVTQAHGPANAVIAVTDISRMARLCRVAGWQAGEGCEELQPAFAEAPIVGPVEVAFAGGRVARYAEWPRAVRIEVSAEEVFARAGLDRATVLTLTFDPARSGAADLLEHPELATQIRQIGRKQLRRILRTVALTAPAPTLVQHRLLALAA